MNRREKELLRLVNERLSIRIARPLEKALQKRLMKQYRDAVKNYKDGRVIEPAVMLLVDKIEEDLYSTYIRAYEASANLTKKQIENTKSIKLKEKKDDVFYNAMMNFARLWAGDKAVKVSRTTMEDINSVIQAGLVKELGVAVIAEEIIRKGITESAHRAHAIARTEVHSAQMAGSIEMAKESEVVAMKEWVSVYDDRTRRGDNSDFDHTIVKDVPLNQDFNVSGEYLEYPGDPKGSAGNIINCRCAVVYYD